MTPKQKSRLAALTGLVIFGTAWQLASKLVGEYWVPGIGDVLQRLWKEFQEGKLVVDIASTTQLLLVGTALGAAGGCTLACLLRLSSRLDALMQPFVTALMSVPKLGLVPLLVLWFGTGWTPKVMLVALTVLFIVFALTYSGLITVDARLVMTARVLGASPGQVTRSIVIPSVLPFAFTGLQVALPWAVSAALVAEYLAAKTGVGHSLEQARQMSDSVGVYCGIVVATLLVLACNAALAAVRKLSIRSTP